MNQESPLFKAIVSGRLEEAVEATRQSLSCQEDAHSLISDQMIPAMQEIGLRFEQGQAFVPELLMAARAMKGALELVKPTMQNGQSYTLGRVVIGTVYGDLHDIGKNLVASMLEGCGFEVINLGVNVPAERFTAAVIEHNADILCLSALLTTTMVNMQKVIEALHEAGIRDKVKVMVGGAPVTSNFAKQIGADAYSENANEAVAVTKQLLKC